MTAPLHQSTGLVPPQKIFEEATFFALSPDSYAIVYSHVPDSAFTILTGAYSHYMCVVSSECPNKEGRKELCE